MYVYQLTWTQEWGRGLSVADTSLALLGNTGLGSSHNFIYSKD
jgi:hypothetical protein